MTESNDKQNKLTMQSLAKTLEEVKAQLEAATSRLDVLESLQSDNLVAKSSKEDAQAKAASTNPNKIMPASQSMVGQPVGEEAMARYAQIEARRNELAQSPKYAKPAKAQDAAQLRQRMTELEGQNFASARGRLSDMKVKNMISGFIVIPPGGTTPPDIDPRRVLVTVDKDNIIISADLG